MLNVSEIKARFTGQDCSRPTVTAWAADDATGRAVMYTFHPNFGSGRGSGITWTVEGQIRPQARNRSQGNRFDFWYLGRPSHDTGEMKGGRILAMTDPRHPVENGETAWLPLAPIGNGWNREFVQRHAARKPWTPPASEWTPPESP